MQAGLDCTAAGDVRVVVESESESDGSTGRVVGAGPGRHGGGGSSVPGGGGGAGEADAATVPPLNQAGEGDEPTHREVKEIMAATCKDLLQKLETVRLSVLHLQYSLHTGALAENAAETVERSDKLWAWNEGGVFSAELAHGGRLQGALHNVFGGGFPADPGLAYTDCAGGWVGARGGGGGDGSDGRSKPDGQQQPQEHEQQGGQHGDVDAAYVGAGVTDGVDARGVHAHGDAGGVSACPRMLAAGASLDNSSTVGCEPAGGALWCGRIVACALGDGRVEGGPYDV